MPQAREPPDNLSPTKVVVERLHHRIDMRTLHRDEGAQRLGLNEIGRVILRMSAPLLVDDYRRNRATGSFILIDEASNETVGAGVILQSAVHGSDAPVARNLTWHEGSVTRERRWAALGQRGATIWLTGLSGSGKSTIASALEERLVGARALRLRARRRQPAPRPQPRSGLRRSLAYGERPAGGRGRASAGRRWRRGPRRADQPVHRRPRPRPQPARASGLEFAEVHVHTSLETCERRDPKGLYAKARGVEIPGFTVVSARYEAPPSPDLRLDGGGTVADAVDELLGLLARGVVIVE